MKTLGGLSIVLRSKRCLPKGNCSSTFHSKAATKVVDDFSVEKRKMTWPENCALALPPIYAGTKVMAIMVIWFQGSGNFHIVFKEKGYVP